MANRFRVSVKFGDAKVLVPCGDGAISVDKLIENAIGRFKKNKKLHQDDEIIVDNLYQEDGSIIDRDDEVADVLDDKEMVIAAYKHIPHDAQPGFEPVLIGDPNTSQPDQTPSNNDKTQPSNKVIPSMAAPSMLQSQPLNPPTLSISPSASSYNAKSYSPTPSYEADIYQRDFMTTPTNLYPNHHELMKGKPEGDATQDEGYTTDDIRGHRQSEEAMMNGRNLSQEIDNNLIDFSQEHSQVSIHSEENHLMGSQKYSNNNTPSYDIDLLTMDSQEIFGQQEIPQINTRSSSQHNLDSFHKQQMVEPPYRKPVNQLPFSHSQSMERLHEVQQPHQNPNYFNGRMGTAGLHYPTLSQDFSASQDMSYNFYEHQMMGGSSYMMTQPEPGSMMNPRMYAQMHGRYGRPVSTYDLRSHPYAMQQQRGQYPPAGRGGHDPYDRRGNGDYYHGYHAASQYDHPDQRRRSTTTEFYDDYYSGGMRGVNPRYSQPVSRGWNKNFEEDYPQRPRDDDITIDYHLSQPSSLGGGGGNRHGHQLFHSTPGGRLANAPSGYSLSQPGGGAHGMRASYDRYKQKKSALKNRTEQSPRSDIRDIQEEPLRERAFSIDDELFDDGEFDVTKSPFQRSARKSLRFLDSSWGRWEEKLMTMDLKDDYEPEVPNLKGAPAPTAHSPVPKKDDDNSNDDDDDDLENNNLHVVELLRGDEPLGIRLVSYTSEGRDLGVFIESLDDDGFASKSGNLQPSDRILACNGEDFTKESNDRVEERFSEMAEKEPLLRLAISRGFKLDLDQNEIGDADDSGEPPHGNNITPSGETSSPPSAASNQLSNVFTNTRQIGMKHTIIINRSPTGTFGFGLSSRDVTTKDNDQPIYIKSITTGGPAFIDGRLRLGDRLLEVNGESVKGKTQSEAVNLLKSSGDQVTVVISRQEQVENQEEVTDDPSSLEMLPLVSSVGKTVMILDIPLTTGLAGLGVTVHGRCNSKKQNSNDMGIYIKSIVPGGAAARDGRLKVHDHLLSVNDQPVTNMSNGDALEALKRALSQADPNKLSNIRLTIARNTGGMSKKNALSKSSFSSNMPALKEEERVDPEGGHIDKGVEMGIDCPIDMNSPHLSQEEFDIGSHNYQDQNEDLRLSRSSLGSQGSNTRLEHSIDSYTENQRHHSVDRDCPTLDSHYLSHPHHAVTTDRNSPRANRQRNTVGTSSPREYERRRKPTGMNVDDMNHLSLRQESLSPVIDEMWLNSLDHSQSSYIRSASIHSELSINSQPTHISYQQNLNHKSLNHPSFSSTSSLTSFTQRSRDSSFRRTASPPYDTLEESTPPLNKRNINSTPESYTLPRMGNSRSSGGRYTVNERPTTNEDGASLVSYSSDTELNYENPFQRDHIARKSIPKKKNTPQPNLSHLQLANEIPQLEGEGSPSPPLYRTGSDSDLPATTQNRYYEVDMLNGVEVGPNLRMAKSSSLESLQTILHYTINADVGKNARGRNNTRNSFRRAVDRSYHSPESREESNAIISLTKNPKKKSRNFFKTWMKSKKTSSNSSKSKKEKRRSRAVSQNFDFTPDSINELAKEFGISSDTILRMQSHSGRLEGDELNERDERRERERITREMNDHTSYNTREL